MMMQLKEKKYTRHLLEKVPPLQLYYTRLIQNGMTAFMTWNQKCFMAKVM